MDHSSMTYGDDLAAALLDELAVAMYRQRRSQTSVAAELGVSAAWMSRRFNGRTPITLAETLGLASLLAVDLGPLLDAASATVPPPVALAVTTDDETTPSVQA